MIREPESSSRIEQDAQREEALAVDGKLKAEQLKQQQQITMLRGKFAKKVYCLVAWWLVAVLGLMTATGLDSLQLSDGVLIAIVSGATVNVVALLFAIVKFLFPAGPAGLAA